MHPARARTSGEYSPPRLDRGLDGVDALGQPALLLRLPGAVRVLLRQLVEPGFETVELGPLGVGRGRGRGMHPSEARGGAPVRIEHRLGPLPVGRELIGGHAQALHGEVREELRVIEPQPLALGVIGEEVAVERAARGRIRLHAHEAGERRRPRHPALGESAPHLPGREADVPGAELLVDRHLPRGVGGHRERLHGVEVERSGAVGVEQRRGGVAEAQPLRDHPFGDAEPGGDGGGGGAPGGEAPEGVRLVGGVHGDAHHVLGQGELPGRGVARVHAAGHGVVHGDDALGGQRLQGREAAPARNDRVAGTDALDGAHHEGGEEAVGGEGRLELGERRRLGRGRAHVLGRGLEGVERELTDGVGQVVHGGFSLR